MSHFREISPARSGLNDLDSSPILAVIVSCSAPKTCIQVFSRVAQLLDAPLRLLEAAFPKTHESATKLGTPYGSVAYLQAQLQDREVDTEQETQHNEIKGGSTVSRREAASARGGS